jgi:hypothetical protein
MNPHPFVDSRSVDLIQKPWTSSSQAFSDTDLRDIELFIRDAGGG